MANGLIITVSLIAAYVIGIYWLVKTNKMEKWNLSLALGFILMIRTEKGRGILDKLSKPRKFWAFFGDLGTGFALVGMVLMTMMFLVSALQSLSPSNPLPALGAKEILIIPGVNPFVPLWYGLIALIVALVVHEGGHGVLARANGMHVRSLGLLLAVVPIGAFVEPDEADLQASSRRKRLRVFAAGPMVNIVVAALTLGLFAWGVTAAEPIDGVGITSITADSPAAMAGLQPLDIITHIEDVAISSQPQFAAEMDRYDPGDLVNFTDNNGVVHPVTVGVHWDYLTPAQQEYLLRENATQAMLLQTRAFLGVGLFDHAATQSSLGEPLGHNGQFAHIRLILGLPLLDIGFLGEPTPILSAYLPTFFEPAWGGAVYWPLVTTAFWIFWINLMLGLTNILPALPLDGGHIFRDTVGGIVEKLRPNMNRERREKAVGRAAAVVSLTILFALLMQILGPRLISAFA